MSLQAQLYMVKGMIAELDSGEQEAIENARRAIRAALEDARTNYGEFADLAISVTMIEVCIEMEKR